MAFTLFLYMIAASFGLQPIRASGPVYVRTDGTVYLPEAAHARTLGSQRVELSGSIYIRADGSVSPPGAPISSSDNITYILNGNITSPIVIERNNTIIDGNGHTLEGDGSANGFSLYSISGVTIRNTNIKNFTYGIHVESASQNIISGNNLTANTYDGISLDSSSNNSIFKNNVAVNGWFGIGLFYSSNNSIAQNNIVANSDGIRLLYSSNNSISLNNVTANQNGIQLFYSSENSIFHNNLLNNSNQSHTESSSNVWDNGSKGNYWSDYNGTDLNQDNIGDTPYIIDANNQDRYPLMKPYAKPGLTTDINKDGTVNILDIFIVAQAFGSKPGDPNWNAVADLDNNGIINILDVFAIARDYGKTTRLSFLE